jgi:hypothetical protein
MLEETATAPEVKNYAYNESVDDIPQPFEQETEKPAQAEEKPATPQADVPTEKAEAPVEKPVEAEKPAEVTAADWKKVLKDNNPDKYEVLKELGYDDWTIGMIKYKDQTGSVDPYVQVKSVDYTKMTPEQLVRLRLQKENEGMSEKALNFKIKNELNEKYYLNRQDYPEDSDEAVYGQEQLRLDGEKQRKAYIEEQNKFKAPEPQPDLDATKREADLQRQRAALGDTVMNNPATTNLLTKKGLTFGEGKESFYYPIENPKSIVDLALNTILNSGINDLSKLNMDDFLGNLAFGQNKKAIIQGLIDQGKALGKKSVQDELGNITPPEGDGQPAVETSKKDYAYKTS